MANGTKLNEPKSWGWGHAPKLMLYSVTAGAFLCYWLPP